MTSYASLTVVLCLFGAAVVQAGIIGHAAAPAHHEEYAYAKPHYQFKYGVHDAHTGDVKEAWEERDGDVVKGSYSLVEADGTHRQVDYTSDAHNGFNAVVKKTGKAVHPVEYGHGHGHSGSSSGLY